MKLGKRAILVKESSNIEPKNADNATGLPRGESERSKQHRHSPFRRGQPVQHELSVLALFKGKERYIYVYDDESRGSLVDAIRDQAAQPKLSLSWFDAAILTERARQQALEAEAERQASRDHG